MLPRFQDEWHQKYLAFMCWIETRQSENRAHGWRGDYNNFSQLELGFPTTKILPQSLPTSPLHVPSKKTPQSPSDPSPPPAPTHSSHPQPFHQHHQHPLPPLTSALKHSTLPFAAATCTTPLPLHSAPPPRSTLTASGPLALTHPAARARLRN